VPRDLRSMGRPGLGPLLGGAPLDRQRTQLLRTVPGRGGHWRDGIRGGVPCRHKQAFRRLLILLYLPLELKGISHGRAARAAAGRLDRLHRRGPRLACGAPARARQDPKSSERERAADPHHRRRPAGRSTQHRSCARHRPCRRWSPGGPVRRAGPTRWPRWLADRRRRLPRAARHPARGNADQRGWSSWPTTSRIRLGLGARTARGSTGCLARSGPALEVSTQGRRQAGRGVKAVVVGTRGTARRSATFGRMRQQGPARPARPASRTCCPLPPRILLPRLPHGSVRPPAELEQMADALALGRSSPMRCRHDCDARPRCWAGCEPCSSPVGPGGGRQDHHRCRTRPSPRHAPGRRVRGGHGGTPPRPPRRRPRHRCRQVDVRPTTRVAGAGDKRRFRLWAADARCGGPRSTG